MKGPAETLKVDGRSYGRTKVDGSLPKVLHKHKMLTEVPWTHGKFTEGPTDAGNVDGRSRGPTEI